ncbi:riboflavin kinase [Microbacterium paraoxydans]|uniref:riboflavin kinase n=1 Tax=Microbacterium paraoxydans TaxID=199592 RepID=A0ABS5IPK3_9MICO|nr:riboflavin kinase [Microbacterium paraoxydans]MBS0024302.1 riboflavin kinase [Microbacterium paraoxydans]
MSAPLRTVAGRVVRGDGRGRGLGFPTANLAVDAADLPADGIYAARVRIDHEAARRPATVSIGANPTFDGDRERRVEVHLHDADLDLYGHRLHVELLTLLRPTLCFDTVAELIAQTAADVEHCRAVLAAG